MADDFNRRPIDPSHELPLPEQQRPEALGREFADPTRTEAAKLGNAFADPNSLDDARLGKAFIESNASSSTRKKKSATHGVKPESRRILYVFLIGLIVVFLLIFLLGWLPRHSRDKAIREQAERERNADPVVEVVRVKGSGAGGGLVVPGTTTALTEAFVYARANGYLKKRFVDIGDHVREGQLLALIDAPDLDQQVDQAREQVRQAESQLNQQRAQLALTKVTVERYRVLVAKGVFSRQQGDQTEADYASQVANVASAERNVEAFKANLRRVIALQGYERVTAPFSGIITQRNVDVGALISASGAAGGAASGPSPQGQASSSGGSTQTAQSNNAGSSGSVNQAATSSASPGQGGPLFGIAQVQRLRILVSVPEGYAGNINPGVHAQLNFQEYPQRVFSGEVTRTSGSLDQNTRTLLTEIQVDNRDGKLLPGMYAVATFPPVAGVSPLLVPGDAIAIRNDRTVIATVVDSKIRFAPVTIGRDYGPSLEVLNGIREGDLVVTNVSDDVVDGRKVKAEFSPTQQGSSQQKPEQNQPPGGSSQYGNQGVTDQNMQGKQGQENEKGNGKQQKRSSPGSKP
jgi:multidrug efflux pump subunit AcrA (membrane-fusion protein)